MASYSDDAYDPLDDDSGVMDDPAGDLGYPGPSSEGESDAFGGSASTPTGESTEEAIERLIGNSPNASAPFSIADEVDKDEKGRYVIPPAGSDDLDSEEEERSYSLDDVEGPSEEDLIRIELEELNKKKKRPSN